MSPTALVTAPTTPTEAAHACPTDFAYWRRKDDPRVLAARRVARRMLGFDLCPDDNVAALLSAGLRDGDPVAEAFVDEVMFGTAGPRGGRGLLDRALAEGIDAVEDAPPAMRVLFDEFEHVPDWVAPALLEKGAAIWRRWGTDLFAVAGASTLEMYTEAAVALPLSLTGGYAGDKALHRFLETVRFWIDVSQPGALMTPGSAGRATAMRVRVMHVSVRRRVAEHPEWDASRWGLPISQTAMLYTLMGGSVAPALLLWPIGYLTTGAEMRALLHFQRYLGHLLGVRPHWYPETIRESVQLLAFATLSRTHTAGTHGDELIESFPRAFAARDGLTGPARIRALATQRLMEGYSLLYTAPRTRRDLDMPNTLTLAAPLARIPTTLAASLARRVAPSLDRLLEHRSAAARERWLHELLAGRDTRFEAASQLRR